MEPPVRPKRIMVIGGGVCGLVTLRNLIERGSFDTVELVERRDDVGGVWYLDEHGAHVASKKPRWPSPAYPGLIGNVLPEFLSFSGAPFPEPPTTPQQPFPTLKETYDYLRQFADRYSEQGNIRLNTEVVRVEELQDRKGWRVVTRDWSTDSESKISSDVWDGVVVCTGWYNDPLWPETEGIDLVREKGLAVHAKWYRGPQNYAGKRALVIGNGNSSNDIASHLAPLAQSPVYRSIRRPALRHFVSLPDSRIQDVVPVKRFSLQSDNKVTAELQDGTTIEDIDVVFIGSGYLPNPSFLYVRSPESPSGSLSPLMSQISAQAPQSRRIPSLHRHILYAYNPSLAFIGSVMCFTPFTIADVSSMWLTLAWADEVAYPSTSEERLQFEKDRIEDVERRRGIEAQETGREASSLFTYSALGTSEEDYAAALKREIVAARTELKNVLPEWNDERRTWRQSMYPIKHQSLQWLKKQREQKATVVENGVANGNATY
ncbi:hypothetical protein J3R30DRAFT_3657868 [Lentinula aciculospora]|uniref:FAD/NAD(P)-binding domain-containing protein n=1 Tax=Lentinula aciculospora TaxID=153920 RepID=A0A9W9A986_9AGAR|nr:hypothetical protein J3R30DRAFT_3657868 [Lentinula aciculospora]